MPKDFRKFLKSRAVIFDGATGTMLQRLGLKPGGCPDELNLTQPELVKKVHLAYKKAGSHVVTTNTFGANRIKLAEYGLEKKLREINMAAVKNAKEATGKNLFVAGGIGPTGRFIKPVGDMDFIDAVSVFSEQATALKAGGADLIIIETMMDIKEMKAAIIGAKETGLPVIATMTFDLSMRTILGTSPKAFAIIADSLGADCIGANCSLGIEGIYKALTEMNTVTDLPLIAQPNAGIPVLKDNETIFPATPEEMTEYVPKLVSVGVRVLGGCCGTMSEHIEKMGKAFLSMKQERKTKKYFSSLSSRTAHVLFGNSLPPITIGERINPTGRKTLAVEIKAGKTAMIRQEAKEQTESGAHVLDVNVGVPGIDEISAMTRAVFIVNENTACPIVIDSANPAVIEAGLKACDGKPLINSVSGEEKKLSTILPLAKKYGAAVLGLCLDDNGIPATAEGRLKVAKKILSAAKKAGIKKEDVFIDCLAMTVSAEPKGALETMKAIRLVKQDLGLTTALGVSNISFGLPSRETVNASFLSMAMAAGLDAKADRYIKRFETRSPSFEKPVQTKKPESLEEKLSHAVISGDEENIVNLVEEAIQAGWGPLKIGNEGLIPGLDEVGRLFACNKYFLPQVILSADTVKKAFTRLKKEFHGQTGPSLGKVIMATVEGDIHDIGKNIVSTLLENHGFEVIDLGKNVPAKKIVEEAIKTKADIVGLSALMTTTVMEMDNVIKRLKQAGVNVKTIVGGAVVTPEFAKKIGADEYGGDATAAVERIKRLVGKKQ